MFQTKQPSSLPRAAGIELEKFDWVLGAYRPTNIFLQSYTGCNVSYKRDWNCLVHWLQLEGSPIVVAQNDIFNEHLEHQEQKESRQQDRTCMAFRYGRVCSKGQWPLQELDHIHIRLYGPKMRFQFSLYPFT